MELNTPTSSRTITEVISETDAPEPVLRLRLHKPKSKKAVRWDQNTVDNEHLNRKKSKCCCIYVKPLEFGESSSEEDDECEHCHGHVELKKKNRKKIPDEGDGNSDKKDDGGNGADPNDKPPDSSDPANDTSSAAVP